MKCAVGIDSGGIINMPSFIRVDSGFQKLQGGGDI
jgi:hypothetical protein